MGHVLLRFNSVVYNQKEIEFEEAKRLKLSLAGSSANWNGLFPTAYATSNSTLRFHLARAYTNRRSEWAWQSMFKRYLMEKQSPSYRDQQAGERLRAFRWSSPKAMPSVDAGWAMHSFQCLLRRTIMASFVCISVLSFFFLRYLYRFLCTSPNPLCALFHFLCLILRENHADH